MKKILNLVIKKNVYFIKKILNVLKKNIYVYIFFFENSIFYKKYHKKIYTLYIFIIQKNILKI